MRRLILWSLLGLFSVAMTALAFFPAAYLAPLIEKNTQGRITLGDAQGTIWQGSAFIGSAPGGNAAITPLLPGRFNWRISPLIVLGNVNIQIENAATLSNAIHINGNWHELAIGPAAIALPAERLSSLGAPLNTLQPSGQMRLSWQVLRLSFAQGMANMNGIMNLELRDIASRLSPIKPLGAYNLALTWHGQVADVALATRQGPMLLNGTGTLDNGHLTFNGTAQAAAGQEDRLANLLNLLGQRRNMNDKDIIVLSL